MSSKLNLNNKPLIVIVGPTASGKSELALSIAKKYKGEIIAADSRTIYKSMDIGTAKPSKEDTLKAPHHLLDIISPSEFFTAAEFKRRAVKVIEEIHTRGNVPIMVGGTGLYIDGVIFDYAFLPPADISERSILESLSIEQLQEILIKQGIKLPENSKNPRHLIRAIETNGRIAVRKGLRKNTLVLGIDIEKEELIGRIEKRVNKMLKDGLLEEVSALSLKFGWDAPGLLSPGYRDFKDYFEGQVSLDDMKEKLVRNHYQLARRQRTWFKRNQDIKWIKNSLDCEEVVKKFLQQDWLN